jgi:hypothetical protein
MKRFTTTFRIFLIALFVTLAAVTLKYFLHLFGLEIFEPTSLHNSVISSVIFVIGFVLSATIADYKESERIPAEFASTIENMYEDARTIHKTYPKFKLNAFREDLIDILAAFRAGTRVNRKGTRREIGELNDTFTAMEAAGVPANFIVKLKQQQATLLRLLFRVNYIQRIKFIPSAFILIRSLVGLVIIFLMLTNIEPFYGGLTLTGMLTFILIYMMILIQTVSVPFHDEGKTRDDVSLFLLKETRAHLKNRGENEA